MAKADKEKVDAFFDELEESYKTKSSPKAKAKRVEPVSYFKARKESKGKKLSTLFGVKVPDGMPDPQVITFEPEDWDEQVRSLIPEKDKGYVFQPKELVELIVGLQAGDNCWIAGPTGSGKTTLVQQYCAVVGRPFIRVNGRGDMESGPIFGQYKVENQETVWVDGACTEAVKYGALYCQDEPTVLPAEIAMGYQWLLETDGKLFLADKAADMGDKLIEPHPEFRFVCCDNTRGLGDETGAYAGTNVWNTATLDRFNTTIHLDYLAIEHEIAIIKGRVPEVTEEFAKRCVQLANIIRTAYQEGDMSFTLSPRTLISWANKAVIYQSPSLGLKVAFYQKLSSEDERLALARAYQTVFAEELN